MGSSTAKIKRQSCAAETESTTIRKGNPYRFGQPLTKRFGKSGSQVPPPQQFRIVEKYVRGMSIRRIAEEEDRARQTVTKIVRAPEVQDYMANLQAEVIGLGDEMVRSVQFALRNEMDGRLGFEMLKAIGVVPVAAQIQPANETNFTEQHRKLAEEWTMKLGILAIEKHKVYGTELTPDLEELKQRLEELEPKSTEMQQSVTPELKPSRKRHASLRPNR